MIGHNKNINREINIPVLSQQEVWQRNERFKNWGKYTPMRFLQGKPKYILPRVSVCIYYTLLQILSAWAVLSDIVSTSVIDIRSGLTIMLIGVGFFSFYKLISTDPGIQSSGAAIINLSEMSQYHNFCTECKCYQDEKITHCPSCQVCINSSYAHLSISSLCLTRQNILPFIVLCVSSIFQGSLLML